MLNRKWFLAAGITAVSGTAVCVILQLCIGGDPKNAENISIAFAFLQLIVLGICEEWLARNMESNIRCRFTDMVLAGGISKNMFVMSELIKNLLTIAVGAFMCILMQLVMFTADHSYMTVGTVKMVLCAALFVGTMDWTINPPLIAFKSAEKASMLIVAMFFFIVFPLFVIVVIFIGDPQKILLFDKILSLPENPWFVPALIGLCASVYAVFYFILLKRVKRGDVC